MDSVEQSGYFIESDSVRKHLSEFYEHVTKMLQTPQRLLVEESSSVSTGS